MTVLQTVALPLGYEAGYTTFQAVSWVLETVNLSILHPLLHPITSCPRKTRKTLPRLPIVLSPDGPMGQEGWVAWSISATTGRGIKSGSKRRTRSWAGEPRKGVVGCSVADLVNRFLDAKKLLIASGELSARTWRDYYLTSERLVNQFGKFRAVAELDGQDFERLRGAGKKLGPVSLGNEIQRIRTILKFAWDEQLIPGPVRFGSTFKKPSLRTMRKATCGRAEDARSLRGAEHHRRGGRSLEGDGAGAELWARQSRRGQSHGEAIDLDTGWLDYPRENRHRPLSTLAGNHRGDPRRNRGTPRTKIGPLSELGFLTRSGNSWVRVRTRTDKPGLPIDSIQKEWRKLLKAAKVPHVSFYCLRHIHRTIADDEKDQPAADHIMGHVDPSMAGVYRERISDERLDVKNRVRKSALAGKLDNG